MELEKAIFSPNQSLLTPSPHPGRAAAPGTPSIQDLFIAPENPEPEEPVKDSGYCQELKDRLGTSASILATSGDGCCLSCQVWGTLVIAAFITGISFVTGSAVSICNNVYHAIKSLFTGTCSEEDAISISDSAEDIYKWICEKGFSCGLLSGEMAHFLSPSQIPIDAEVNEAAVEDL